MRHPHPYVTPVSASRAEAIPAVWLRKAQAGDCAASSELLGWAYESARTYYGGKVGVETLLTRTDAEELAGMFLLEFERAWPRIRCVTRYTRRMLRNNLRRYLHRKREHRAREAVSSTGDLDQVASPDGRPAGMRALDRWGDEERLQLAAVHEVLARTDQLTRHLMTLRCGDPPLSYGVIADRLGSTEAALRMRATRFYRTVRATHSAMIRGRTSVCHWSTTHGTIHVE